MDPASVLRAMRRETEFLGGTIYGPDSTPPPATPAAPVVRPQNIAEEVNENLKVYLAPNHCNDQAPNYRENGQIRLMKCFSCEPARQLVMFGVSRFSSCPHCQWEEAAAFDWCEMQMVVFEAVVDAILKVYPRKFHEAAWLAMGIIGGATGQADPDQAEESAMFLCDASRGQFYAMKDWNELYEGRFKSNDAD